MRACSDAKGCIDDEILYTSEKPAEKAELVAHRRAHNKRRSILNEWTFGAGSALVRAGRRQPIALGAL
jgi:hypothetical protein